MQDVSDKYILLEETEKQALRKALIEERQRFCCFVAMLQPVVVSTVGEIEREMSLRKALREKDAFSCYFIYFFRLLMHLLFFSPDNH